MILKLDVLGEVCLKIINELCPVEANVTWFLRLLIREWNYRVAKPFVNSFEIYRNDEV